MLIYLMLIAVGFYLSKWIGAIFFPLAYLLIINRKKIKALKIQYQKVKQGYPRLLFLMIGHVAKLDGRVLPVHIQFAETMMEEFTKQFSKKQMQAWFNQGKRMSSQQMHKLLREAAEQFVSRGDIRRSFIEIALTAIHNGKGYTEKNTQFIQHCLQDLRLDASVLETFEQRHHEQLKSTNHVGGIKQAYATLGLTQSADLVEIKHARKKLLNIYHPDKLRQASPEERKQADEMVNKINRAYTQIKSYKGF